MLNNPTEKEVRAAAQMNAAVKLVKMVCTNVTVDADFAAIISTALGKNRGLYHDVAHKAFQREVLVYLKLLSEGEAKLGQEASRTSAGLGIASKWPEFLNIKFR